jgi:hypothetical protein
MLTSAHTHRAPTLPGKRIAIRPLALIILAVLFFGGERLGAQADTSRGGTIQRSPAEHRDSPLHGHGADPIFGLHFGFPAAASAAVGYEVWLGDRIPGAAFADVEPGVFAMRYGVGYLVSEGAPLTSGAALRLVRLRGWTNAFRAVSGVKYTGAELMEMVFLVSARAGLYAGRRNDGRRVWLGSFDLGFGF